MQFANLSDEQNLGAADVLDRLAGLGIREESHEVDRVTGAQRDADLALLLEAADARTVPGARIDDDERPLSQVGRLARLGFDAHQCIVDRALELSAIQNHLVVEHEHRRLAGPVVLDRLIAALAQHVPEQDLALHGVDPVFPRLVRPATGPRDSLLRGRRRRFGSLRPFRRRFHQTAQGFKEHARRKGKCMREGSRSRAPAIAATGGVTA